jgi:hypothetical protein
MQVRAEVAQYAAAMTRELCRMCRQVHLDDLAFLLEVAASEAARARAGDGPRLEAVEHGAKLRT